MLNRALQYLGQSIILSIVIGLVLNAIKATIIPMVANANSGMHFSFRALISYANIVNK